MSSTVNLANTPIAPYIGLLNGMRREEKMALMLFLIDSLPGVEVVESASQDEDAFLKQSVVQRG